MNHLTCRLSIICHQLTMLQLPSNHAATIFQHLLTVCVCSLSFNHLPGVCAILLWLYTSMERLKRVCISPGQFWKQVIEYKLWL
jgi:hypothetical protein